ncbi:MAG TPA: hypothetical protein VIY51_16315 [Xanthobacteraceae bacterium]
MPIVPLLTSAAFDSETARLLGLAFEAAWQTAKKSFSALPGDADAASERELLAKSIIEMAKQGERDHDRLVENALAHLARSKEISNTTISTKSNLPISPEQIR